MKINIHLMWEEASGHHSVIEDFSDEKEAYKWLLDVSEDIAVKEAEYLSLEGQKED